MESMELVPGSASALYGPNAFNGILFMNSKSPFEYQGLSAQSKVGVTNSNANGTDPYYNLSVRYAKSFNDKFAFKVNVSYLSAQDWRANNYDESRTLQSTIDDPTQVGDPNYDGLNLYGDEIRIPVNYASPTTAAAFAAALAPSFASAFGNDTTQAEAALNAGLPL